MQVVLPTPHRKAHTRRTPTSLASLAKKAWQRPSSRDLVFSTLPFRRVLSAWLAIAVVLRINDAIRVGLLVPAVGDTTAGVLSSVLSVASVVAVTHPFFRVYAGQWPEVLAWYGFVLAMLTVAFETFFLLYVHQLFGYEVLARYNVLNGELWPFVVVSVGLTPLIWAHWAQA